MALGRSDSVSRALQIIETVADLGIGTTGQEIAQHLRLPPASTYRLLNNLVADEFLVRTADLRGFALGTRLSSLVAAVLPPPVPARARALIEEFRSSVRFAVHVVYFRPATASGNSRSTLRVLDPDPDHPLTGVADLIRHPHASAPGKILLASMSQWREMVGPAPMPLTPSTIVDLSHLGAEIAQVRRTDVAVDDGELVCDHAHIAVPIYDVDGDVRGAVVIGGVSSRLDAIRSLTEAAQGLANTLAPLLF